MTTSQRKAVARHRDRQNKRGIIRLEINVPEQDRDLMRAAAARLRSGGLVADQTRLALEAALQPFDTMSFKELLEAAPLEGVDLERSKETWRDIEF